MSSAIYEKVKELIVGFVFVADFSMTDMITGFFRVFEITGTADSFSIFPRTGTTNFLHLKYLKS